MTLDLVNRFWAGRAGLPRPLPYRRVRVRVPLRDGVHLGADLLLPRGLSKGVLLVRGPYGRGRLFSMLATDIFAGQGYTVLFVSSRGTADSEGEFDPMRTEAADGQDVVVWMRMQEWYPGRFGTVGASYLGHTQWALMADPPDDLTASVVVVGPHDFAEHHWGTGAFGLDFLSWADQDAFGARPAGLRSMRRLATAATRLGPVLDAVPLEPAASAYFAASAPWVRDRLLHPDIADDFWAGARHSDALERVNHPVMIVAGWQDPFIAQSIQQYSRLRARGVTAALVAGPWTHVEAVGPGGIYATGRAVEWLDTHLAKDVSGTGAAPAVAHVQVRGSQVWHELESWPPVSEEWRLYLTGGRLTDDATGSEPIGFTWNPDEPTPLLGGQIVEGGGYTDDSPLYRRADVATFASAPLDTVTTIAGDPRVHLVHSAELPDFDLFVRISDLAPDGTSTNITEGYQRFTALAHQGATRRTLTLRPTAYTLEAGHRIALVIAGGSHPHYSRNPGTGENPLTAAVLHANKHTITPGGATFLELPVTAALDPAGRH